MKTRPKLPDDIKELLALVRAGKLFAVQKWIAEGKRIMPPEPYRNCPIQVALEIGFHSMVEVLLSAGIDQNVKDCLLGQMNSLRRSVLSILVYGIIKTQPGFFREIVSNRARAFASEFRACAKSS